MLGQVGNYKFNKTTHNNLKVHVDVAGETPENSDRQNEEQHISQSSRLHQSYETRYKQFAKLMDQKVPLDEIAKQLELSEITLHSQRYLQRYTKHN
ncbi:CBS domain containing-hemolysin-like protein [Weissella uvarum]|uniref:hypothetical protein n=1 Tax=Weissella uvarum TaxID=1479233 RepID=UPI0019621B11|nr:hypothetical protein [Weissella uvarum]MBM7617503.1 CBS domain containing-hemolysin-like protein [Weissella uvarum]MCM0595613.1 hypothetical protein [Weissella uvarum]